MVYNDASQHRSGAQALTAAYVCSDFHRKIRVCAKKWRGGYTTGEEGDRAAAGAEESSKQRKHSIIIL
jgi:hypothetical protein